MPNRTAPLPPPAQSARVALAVSLSVCWRCPFSQCMSGTAGLARQGLYPQAETPPSRAGRRSAPGTQGRNSLSPACVWHIDCMAMNPGKQTASAPFAESVNEWVSGWLGWTGEGWEEALAMGGNASISAQRRKDSIPDTAVVPLWERTQGMVGSERRPACPCGLRDLECLQDGHPGRQPACG